MHAEFDGITPVGLNAAQCIPCTPSAPLCDEDQLHHFPEGYRTSHKTHLSSWHTWGSGDVSTVSPSKHKWPFQFQPLEVTASSGVQVQKALVMKTLRYKTTVEQGFVCRDFTQHQGFAGWWATGTEQGRSAWAELAEAAARLKKMKKRKKQSFSKA